MHPPPFLLLTRLLFCIAHQSRRIGPSLAGPACPLPGHLGAAAVVAHDSPAVPTVMFSAVHLTYTWSTQACLRGRSTGVETREKGKKGHEWYAGAFNMSIEFEMETRKIRPTGASCAEHSQGLLHGSRVADQRGYSTPFGLLDRWSMT